VDESYKEVVYGEKCPTECLRRIKLKHELELGISDMTYTELLSMKYNPNKDKIEEWCKEAEEYHRKLLVWRKGWAKDDLRDVLYEAMKMPFETWELTVKQLGEDGRTYDNYKNIALQLEKKLNDRKELFLEEHIEAKFVKQKEKFKRRLKRLQKGNGYKNKKKSQGKGTRGKLWKGRGSRTDYKKKGYGRKDWRDNNKEKVVKETENENVSDLQKCHLCGSIAHLMKECEKYDPDFKKKRKTPDEKKRRNRRVFKAKKDLSSSSHSSSSSDETDSVISTSSS